MPEHRPLRLAVFASGRGSNAMAIFSAVRSGRLPGIDPVLLVCDREKAPVLEKARESGVPAVQILPRSYPSKDDYEKAILAHLHDKKADL